MGCMGTYRKLMESREVKLYRDFLKITNILFANSECIAEVRFHSFQGTKIRVARGPSRFKLMICNKGPQEDS